MPVLLTANKKLAPQRQMGLIDDRQAVTTITTKYDVKYLSLPDHKRIVLDRNLELEEQRM